MQGEWGTTQKKSLHVQEWTGYLAWLFALPFSISGCDFFIFLFFFAPCHLSYTYMLMLPQFHLLASCLGRGPENGEGPTLNWEMRETRIWSPFGELQWALCLETCLYVLLERLSGEVCLHAACVLAKVSEPYSWNQGMVQASLFFCEKGKTMCITALTCLVTCELCGALRCKVLFYVTRFCRLL